MESESGTKNIALRSRSLQPTGYSSGIGIYDASENEWAKKISDVVVREIVILGLASKPSCIKVAGRSQGIEFKWTQGVAATAGRRRGGAGKTASKLVIIDADLAVVRDWDLVIEFGSTSCSFTPSIDHEAAFQSPECEDGKFLCRNEGHFSSCILRSRVNDGVCDNECCDGSDETDGKIDCPNKCKAVGIEYRKANEEAGRKNRVGGAVRKEYITFGIKEKAKLEAEVAKFKEEITTLERKESAAKVALETVETAEAGDIERKKDSVLYQQIVEMQSAIKTLRLHRANLEGHVSDLSSILSELSVSVTMFFLCA